MLGSHPNSAQTPQEIIIQTGDRTWHFLPEVLPAIARYGLQTPTELRSVVNSVASWRNLEDGTHDVEWQALELRLVIRWRTVTVLDPYAH